MSPFLLLLLLQMRAEKRTAWWRRSRVAKSRVSGPLRWLSSSAWPEARRAGPYARRVACPPPPPRAAARWAARTPRPPRTDPSRPRSERLRRKESVKRGGGGRGRKKRKEFKDGGRRAHAEAYRHARHEVRRLEARGGDGGEAPDLGPVAVELGRARDLEIVLHRNGPRERRVLPPRLRLQSLKRDTRAISRALSLSLSLSRERVSAISPPGWRRSTVF